VEDVYKVIQDINKRAGVTLLIVEQNAFQVLNIADRGYVLETGNIVLEQKAQELLNNDEIKKAYLGE
jgi:branched-chain amino acid transport system ATP-binding protein